MLWTLLGISWALVVAICVWLLLLIRNAWKWAGKAPSSTIQVMTHEEQEKFVEHARKRAWKALYLEVGR
jgi:hypothetical protein